MRSVSEEAFQKGHTLQTHASEACSERHTSASWSAQPCTQRVWLVGRPIRWGLDCRGWLATQCCLVTPWEPRQMVLQDAQKQLFATAARTRRRERHFAGSKEPPLWTQGSRCPRCWHSWDDEEHRMWHCLGLAEQRAKATMGSTVSGSWRVRRGFGFPRPGRSSQSTADAARSSGSQCGG